MRFKFFMGIICIHVIKNEFKFSIKYKYLIALNMKTMNGSIVENASCPEFRKISTQESK